MGLMHSMQSAQGRSACATPPPARAPAYGGQGKSGYVLAGPKCINNDMHRDISSLRPAGGKRLIIAVLLFGIAFGYVEAAVVTYLRPQFFSTRAMFNPHSSRDELFPMLTLEQTRIAGPGMVKTVGTEVVREAATLLMLGAVAAVAGGNLRQWLAFFLLTFGTWDIAYYAFLKILIDWPKSLLTWDILFLIPVPWSGPVLAPALAALMMVAAALAYLWRESSGRPVRLKAIHWLCADAGALLILAAFIWDYRTVMEGGMPNSFNWPLFALGEVLWVAALLHGLGAQQSQTTSKSLPSRIRTENSEADSE